MISVTPSNFPGGDAPSHGQAQQEARVRLDAKLVALGAVAGLSAPQVHAASRKRALDAFQLPGSNVQRWEAYELAQRLEASLPLASGQERATRAGVVLLLLDPPGQQRLAQLLIEARRLVEAPYGLGPA